MKIIFLFVELIISSTAFCQDTVWVKKFVKRIQPFERRYLQYTETKEGTVKLSTLMTRKAEKANYQGREQLLIVQTYRQEKVIDRDSSYCDPETLMPAGYFTDIQSEAHKEQVFFSAEGIRNRIEFKDSVADFTKPNNHWFNGVITDDIIASLPLKEKAVFAFNMVNPGMRYFEYTTVVTVEGKEDLEVPGIGRLSCWRLRVGKEKTGTLEWYTVKGQVQVKKKYVFKNGDIFYRVMVAG